MDASSGENTQTFIPNSAVNSQEIIQDDRTNIKLPNYLWIFVFGALLITSMIFTNVLKTQQDKKISDLSSQLMMLNEKFDKYQISTQEDLDKYRVQFQELWEESNSIKTNVKNEIISLGTNISYIYASQQKSYNLVSQLTEKVADHNEMLIKLLNRTSNAEVLDKLEETKFSLLDEMKNTKLDVSSNLERTSFNVSRQLDKTHTELEKSVQQMQGVVHDAEYHIYDVQYNVTEKLNQMSLALNDTVSNLNIAVAVAQATIHDEVLVVKDKIEEYVLATNVKFAAENDFVKYQLAGFFTLLGCLISLWHMTSHLRHYEKPDVQRRIMAVLWMVPIYGITSWLSLVFDQSEFAFAAIRDFYEAYAIYTFIALLIAVLEDGKGLTELLKMLTKHVIEERIALSEARNLPKGSKLARIPKEHIKPPFPCCFIHHKPSTVAAAWLYQCRLMAMQFVFFKPLLTAIPFIITLSGIDYHRQPILLDDNTINWKAAKLYVVFFQNISVAIAFYGLLSFYHGTEKDLAWCDPWPKFLCIKGVVFMTFWQGLSLQIMSSTGLVDERVASQIQNLLICVEMMLASIAHFYIFPYHEWQPGYKRQREKTIAFRDTLAIKDFYHDMRQMVTPWERPSLDRNSSEDSYGSDINRDLRGIVSLHDGQEFRNGVTSESELNTVSDGIEAEFNSKELLESGINPLFPPFDRYYQISAEDDGIEEVLSSSPYEEVHHKSYEESVITGIFPLFPSNNISSIQEFFALSEPSKNNAEIELRYYTGDLSQMSGENDSQRMDDEKESSRYEISSNDALGGVSSV